MSRLLTQGGSLLVEDGALHNADNPEDAACCCEDDVTPDICHGLNSCGSCPESLLVAVTNRWYFISANLMDVIEVVTLNHRVAPNWCVWGGTVGGVNPPTEVISIQTTRWDHDLCEPIGNPTYFVQAATLQCVVPLTDPDLPHKWAFSIAIGTSGDSVKTHCFAMDNTGPCPQGIMDVCPRPDEITTDCAAGGLGGCWTTSHETCFEIEPTAEVF